MSAASDRPCLGYDAALPLPLRYDARHISEEMADPRY